MTPFEEMTAESTEKKRELELEMSVNYCNVMINFKE